MVRMKENSSSLVWCLQSICRTAVSSSGCSFDSPGITFAALLSFAAPPSVTSSWLELEDGCLDVVLVEPKVVVELSDGVEGEIGVKEIKPECVTGAIFISGDCCKNNTSDY